MALKSAKHLKAKHQKRTSNCAKRIFAIQNMECVHVSYRSDRLSLGLHIRTYNICKQVYGMENNVCILIYYVYIIKKCKSKNVKAKTDITAASFSYFIYRLRLIC